MRRSPTGGRSVELAKRAEAYEEERTTEAEQNGDCDDHIPKLCQRPEAEQPGPHGEWNIPLLLAMTRLSVRGDGLTGFDLQDQVVLGQLEVEAPGRISSATPNE